MVLEHFPDNSQVWIYGADRFLNDDEQRILIEDLSHFLGGWAAHGKPLTASCTILHNNFILIVVNEEEAKASGCSIDTSVHFIKELGKKLEINFFNRLSILIEKDGQYERIHYNDRSMYPTYNYFDLTVKTLDAFNTRFKVPIS